MVCVVFLQWSYKTLTDTQRTACICLYNSQTTPLIQLQVSVFALIRCGIYTLVS